MPLAGAILCFTSIAPEQRVCRSPSCKPAQLTYRAGPVRRNRRADGRFHQA